MDYNSLVGDKTVSGSIALWVNNTTLDTQTILTEAQALIYQHLRTREMIVSDYALVVAQGDCRENLPDGFLDPINLRDLNFCRMKARDLSSVKTRRWQDATQVNGIGQGQPFFFAFTGTTVEFDCAADASAAGTYLLDYYGAPAALSVVNPTNFITARYPMLLRAACMASSASFLNDQPRVQAYSQQMLAMIGDIDVTDEFALRGSETDADYSESRI